MLLPAAVLQIRFVASLRRQLFRAIFRHPSNHAERRGPTILRSAFEPRSAGEDAMKFGPKSQRRAGSQPSPAKHPAKLDPSRRGKPTLGSAWLVPTLTIGFPLLAGSVLCAESWVWQAIPGGRLAALPLVTAGQARLTLQTPAQTGIWFTNQLPESRHLTNQILPNGSGVAAGDIDGDGRCDLFFAGLRDSGSRLYRNDGDWHFTDVTQTAGVGGTGLDTTGAVLLDLDGDGDVDLLVNSLGSGTRLFFNDGDGRFTPGSTLLNPDRGGTSAGLADADGDGDLDLYIANYRFSTLTDMPGVRFSVKMVAGQPTVVAINGRPPTDPEWTNRFRYHFELGPGGRGKFGREELGEPDLYLLNDGHGRFTPVGVAAGVFLDEAGRPLTAPFYDWGLSVLFRDLNSDGAPDLYVCNDFGTPDRLWWNDGAGRFRLAPPLALRQTSLASMAVDAADLDRDGRDDLVVLDMLARDHGRRLMQRNILRTELAPAEDRYGRPQYPRNTLQWNRGDGTYAEIAQLAGIEGTEWSWNPILVDLDLDGYEDLLVPNGFVRDNMNLDAMNRIAAAGAGRRLSALEELHLRGLYPPLNTPNLAFRNSGQLTFNECSHAWGFDTPVISQGACLADLDNDGDPDLIVNNLNAVAGLYRNNTPAPRIAVRLRGRPPNSQGIGARITVLGGPVTQTQEIVAGGRYCSSDQPQRTFAAGAARTLEVRVRWRSGLETVLTNLPPNCLVEVNEIEAARAAPPLAPPPSPFSVRFEDVSQRLGHVHEDQPFDDFERQPLLPRKLSQLGPGIAWWDLDGDGWEDLVIGAGRSGKLAWFHNRRDGQFERVAQASWDEPLARDAAGFAGLRPGSILVAFSNYEDGTTNGPSVAALTAKEKTDLRGVPAGAYGPIAAADYDGDGQLDLFVGARLAAGRYPAPATSWLLRGHDRTLALDLDSSPALPKTLVSAATWTDLTGDGRPELVLACDWGALVVLRNDGGRLVPWDPPVEGPIVGPSGDVPIAGSGAPITLSRLTGWWNGVAAGDFDNDGRLDLVASNWGRNTRYQRWRPEPLRLYFGDVNGDGAFALLEAHVAPELHRFAPDRMLDTVARSLPALASRFPTHAAWAAATIDDVLGDARNAFQHREVVCLESVLLLNRGDRFEVRAFPLEAQFAPAFAVGVADADGDGNEDVFLGQNFFGVDLDTSRYDAGRGLWLRGDGRGRFQPVPGQDSGVAIPGEQRGAAVADFDGDGRIDLVVAQNRAETRLFRNVGARPGLRVRLAGPDGNPFGVGAVVRLRYGGDPGPAREIHAGGGYWSLDSPVLVLATPSPATAVVIRWPGGRTTETPLPPNVREVVIATDGRIETRP